MDRRKKKLQQKIKDEFNRLGVMGYDELNVVRVRQYTKEMYDRMSKMAEQEFYEMALFAYRQTFKDADRQDEEDDLDDGYIYYEVLNRYNPVTGYKFKSETERKMMRLNEQILTAKEYNDRNMFNESLKRGASLWWTQIAEFGIFSCDQASKSALDEMHIKRVQWVAEHDEKTCSTCMDRDGQIYLLADVPPKVHYNCRCTLRAILGDKQ